MNIKIIYLLINFGAWRKYIRVEVFFDKKI
jgi:hypothetical protein